VSAVTKRIICIGNRHVAGDAAGPQVYERLRERALPPGVELVDGGRTC
jgi:Ni,Fe-hydrogenase maturation factor